MKAREAMNGISPDQMTWFPLEGEKPGFTVQKTLGGDIRDFLRLKGLMPKVKVRGLRTKRPQLAKESAHSFH